LAKAKADISLTDIFSITYHQECWCGQRWDGEKMCQPYFINESGLKVDAVTGDLIK